MDEEKWQGYYYTYNGVDYYKHTCIKCGDRWTSHFKYESYCRRNTACRRRAAGMY